MITSSKVRDSPKNFLHKTQNLNDKVTLDSDLTHLAGKQGMLPQSPRPVRTPKTVAITVARKQDKQTDQELHQKNFLSPKNIVQIIQNTEKRNYRLITPQKPANYCNLREI